jgi:hypothetical protein
LQASAAPEGKQRPGTAPSAFSAAAQEDAEARRSASTSAIAASPFANSAFAPGAEDGGQQQQQQQRGLERASSPALGSGVTAQTVATGLPSAPSAPLTDCEGGAGPAAAAAAGRRGADRHVGPSPYYQEYAAPHSGTSSPSVSGILTALPHRGGQIAARGPAGESPRSVSTPRQLGVFASHPIPEEGDLPPAEDEDGGKDPLVQQTGGKGVGVGTDSGGFSVQAR